MKHPLKALLSKAWSLAGVSPGELVGALGASLPQCMNSSLAIQDLMAFLGGGSHFYVCGVQWEKVVATFLQVYLVPGALPFALVSQVLKSLRQTT